MEHNLPSVSPAVAPAPELLLSICVLTYRRPALLARALRSIGLPELPPEVEILVSDNAPADEPEAETIARALLANCPRTQWRYDRNPSGGTVLSNTSHCLARARGEYLYVLHDDDYLLPDGLALLLRELHLVRGRRQVVLFGVQLVDLEQRLLRHQDVGRPGYLAPAAALQRILTNSSMVRMPAIVASRRAYAEHGPLDEEQEGTFDTDTWAHFFGRYGVWLVGQRLAAYTIHEGALTSRTFTPHTLGLLGRLFSKARGLGQLTEAELARAQGQFFHQFVLAGTYRALLRRDWASARQVFALLHLPALRQLPMPVRWLPVRWGFALLTALAWGAPKPQHVPQPPAVPQPQPIAQPDMVTT
ncbi:MAG: glycosyltransferase [Hymenobacter sp.]